MNTVEQWTPLIRSKASKVYRSFNGTVEYEDCLQHGYAIFCEALHSFDPDKGAKFGTWLYWQLKALQEDVKKYQCLPGESEPLEFAVRKDNLWQLTVYLSDDARFLLKLLLERQLHRQSSGPGRTIPGEKTVRNYMREHYGWKKGHSISVYNEIKDWWESNR